MIESGRLTKGHGKALLTEPDHHRRRDLANRAVDSDWSVRKLEAKSRAVRVTPPATRPTPRPRRSGSNSRRHRQHERWASEYRRALTGTDTSSCWTKPRETGSSSCSDRS